MPPRHAFAVLAAVLLMAVASGHSTANQLQSIDWNAVVLSDPRVMQLSDCPHLIDTLGPCIEVAVDRSTPEADATPDDPSAMIVGYAATAPEDVVYGDLDADGTDEAVIRIESGGTAGTIGFLLFRDGRTHPRLVTARSGYKLYPRIEQGRLLVTQPYYFGFEGNCCPSAAVTEMYTLDGDDLVLLSIPGQSPRWSVVGPDGEYSATFAEVVVAGFYRALDHGAFEDAYGFLSPMFQTEHPFQEWRDGFATTRRIEATTLGSRETFAEDGVPAYEVIVSLAVVDELPSGERLGRRFAGVWLVVEGSWPGLSLRLDAARIGEVP